MQGASLTALVGAELISRSDFLDLRITTSWIGSNQDGTGGAVLAFFHGIEDKDPNADNDFVCLAQRGGSADLLSFRGRLGPTGAARASRTACTLTHTAARSSAPRSPTRCDLSISTSPSTTPASALLPPRHQCTSSRSSTIRALSSSPSPTRWAGTAKCSTTPRATRTWLARWWPVHVGWLMRRRRARGVTAPSTQCTLSSTRLRIR